MIYANMKYPLSINLKQGSAVEYAGFFNGDGLKIINHSVVSR